MGLTLGIYYLIEGTGGWLPQVMVKVKVSVAESWACHQPIPEHSVVDHLLLRKEPFLHVFCKRFYPRFKHSSSPRMWYRDHNDCVNYNILSSLLPSVTPALSSHITPHQPPGLHCPCTLKRNTTICMCSEILCPLKIHTNPNLKVMAIEGEV